ncbi:MAG TPA: hypothetical protein VMR45_05295 [Patescibacteria group bacterium]|nr:hypothetical protein [Patescibacteria group bacterium]
MAVPPLILVVNPGSASRKYALFEDSHSRATLHFEFADDRVICTLHKDGQQQSVPIDLHDLDAAAGQVEPILRDHGILRDGEKIERVGLRVVAPSSYFLEDHVIDDEVVSRLEAIMSHAPLHIAATLAELNNVRTHFKDATVYGISDSAFHITKPDYAWNYGLPIEDSDRLEIKRYGYHGLSAAATVNVLQKAEKLPRKLVICHLGSGASVTAVHNGKSIDTTMGYSPLEGLVMSTRCGTIDPTAVRVIKETFHFDDNAIEQYLNNHSGLLGLGGSSDIRELLRREADGDHRASLALRIYVHSVQKAIGQMTAALGGLDMLVFTATVGERSTPIRERVCRNLHYLDIFLDDGANQSCEEPENITCISRLTHSRPVYVVPADEAGEMARRIDK